MVWILEASCRMIHAIIFCSEGFEILSFFPYIIVVETFMHVQNAKGNKMTNFQVNHVRQTKRSHLPRVNCSRQRLRLSLGSQQVSSKFILCEA